MISNQAFAFFFIISVNKVDSLYKGVVTYLLFEKQYHYDHQLRLKKEKIHKNMVNLKFRLNAKVTYDKQSPPSKTLKRCCILTQNCKQVAFDMYILKTGKIINNSTLEKTHL